FGGGLAESQHAAGFGGAGNRDLFGLGSRLHLGRFGFRAGPRRGGFGLAVGAQLDGFRFGADGEFHAGGVAFRLFHGGIGGALGDFHALLRLDDVLLHVGDGGFLFHALTRFLGALLGFVS